MASSDFELQVANLSSAKQALLARKRSQASSPASLHRTEHVHGAPLSFAQQRIWLIQELERGSYLYNVPRVLQLTGKLDRAALEASLNEIIQRHEALRTVFRAESGQPVQVVVPGARIELPLNDLPSGNAMSAREVVLDLVREEYRRPFDLTTAPLLRAKLWGLGENDCILLLVLHHIVSDGWSGSVLFDELGELYGAFAAGRPSPLPGLPILYSDFALWQRGWPKQALDKEIEYWRERLAGAPPTLDLPTDHPRPPDPGFRGHLGSLTLSPDLSRQLVDTSRARNMTVFTTLLATLQILLYQWTGQTDLVVGTVSANRNRSEIEKLIGCFMNFLALRGHVDGTETVLALLSKMKKTVLEAFAHQECPFEKVVEAVNPRRALNVNPLYNVALLMQNYHAFAFKAGGVEARFLPLDTQVAFLDVRFMATETEGRIVLECECNADLFERSTVDLLLTGFRDVLEQVVQQPGREVAAVRIPDALARQAENGSVNTALSIFMAATFTAEPVRPPLNFWMKRLDIPARIQFAPYNRVFQQLLDATSLLSFNRQGVNVILLRIEDLLPSETFRLPGIDDRLSASIRELKDACLVALRRSKVPFLLCVCPPSSAIRAQVQAEAACRRAEMMLAAELGKMPGLSVITSSELLDLYPVRNYDDEYAWSVGHIPYTSPFFNALATIIARRVWVMISLPHEVIVVDCDQTLWSGDLESQTRSGAGVDEPQRIFQEFLAKQQQAGMILCLFGKPATGSITDFFENNQGMPLQWQQIVATRINERPKSENLRELAEELGLNLGHFIFVSANSLECAEVRARCPMVTVVQLPLSEEGMTRFLSHFWPFDGRPTGAAMRRQSRSPLSDQFSEIAAILSTVEEISSAIESETVLGNSGRAGYAPPRTPIEELLVDVWARLLRIEQPGIRDDFFSLGGHSLLAVQVVARVRQLLGLEMPLRTMFEAPTIAEFAERLEAARDSGSGRALPCLKPAPRRGPVPLSYSQQRLWFIDQLEPGNPLYNISAMYRMHGPLHVEALQKTINEIVRRHESLRTTFRSVDGEPMQVTTSPLQLPLSITVREGLLGEERDLEIRRFSREQALRPFDLSSGPLVRFSLLKLAKDDHVLVVVLHHIVGDGWSGNVLAREMATLYLAFVRNRPSPLPELAIQYSDFAIWQRDWMQGEYLNAQLAYWRQQLAGAPALLELPTDRPRPAVQGHRGTVKARVIPRKMLDRVRALSQSEGTTLFMTLLAVFQLLLFRHSGQDDMVVGSTIAGRNYSEIEPLIGFFVKTLAFRTSLAGEPTFRQFLARVKQVALDGYACQDIPFEKLVEELQPIRSLSYNPIFQVLFSLQNLPPGVFEVSDLRVERAPIHPETSLFDMSWLGFETAEGLLMRVEYDIDLFDDATIGRFLDHFEQLLVSIVAHPESCISELPMLTGKERHQVLVEFNSTAVDYPKNLCLQNLFEQQVERTPEAIALVADGRCVTYNDFNERANRLAHRLRRLGVGPDDLVGVCMARSIEMLVALYGVEKAGAAYLPLEPDYPQGRLAAMIEDSKPKVMLTQARLVPILPSYSGTLIALDHDWSQIATEPATNPPLVTGGKNLAYVIYTSGSTGKPKGVLNVHEGIVNRLLWMQDEYHLKPCDRVLQKTPYSFDVSVWEFFWPLMTGASLVIAKPDGHKDPAYLVETIVKEQVTVLHFVPSMLRIFLQAEDIDRCGSLRLVFSSGESLSYELQQRFFHVCKAALHNLYGPTEAAVDVTHWECRPDYSRMLVPIGRPVANTQIYLLDSNLQPVPVGVAAELHIGGVQVAQGYLNRSELTAEKFVPDPFSRRTGARLYKTGDVARFLPDGDIEYVGRVDHQVKIRGLRIELGEIEAALDQHPGVRQSVVMAREDEPENKRLIAYIVPEGTAPLAEDLRAYLRSRLPEFMVPAILVFMESLPLSSNGKVNLRALPAPQYTRAEERVYVAPRNETEEQIRRIWMEVLRIAEVGINDDFFMLGGHSLLATQVIARMRKSFQCDLPLRAIFEKPTVADLATLIRQAPVSAQSALVPAPRDRDLPLSFAQQRLWFLDKLRSEE